MTRKDFRIAEVRAYIPVEGIGGYFEHTVDHWIRDTVIANPMSIYPEYYDKRSSWGSKALGTVVVGGFMGLMGLGIGPALSGLQIALMRTVAPQQIGGAMGSLLLLRQVGGAVALASAETVYRSGLHGHSAAVSTGTGVLAISLAGSLLAALALISLPRGAGRLPAPAMA